MFGLHILKIKGHSMVPTLHCGDFILTKVAATHRFYEVRDIVIIKRLGEAMMIKRIVCRNSDGSYKLAGDNVDSIPKVDIGNAQQQQIVAKALIKLTPTSLCFL